MRKRIVSFLLVLCLCIGLLGSLQASAADYVYPNDWSREALIFAVENGILKGDKHHNLRPKSHITRAEMAAVLVRLLGATEKADLSAYKDVSEKSWYYAELSAAVAAGIFNGISKNRMEPEAPITREQAMVVLCRSFALVDNSYDRFKDFKDRGEVSPYARDSIGMLKSMGIANGYKDGSLHPQSYITRAEVAQLLYNVFDCVADSPDQIPAKGFVIYRGSEPLPKTLTLDGSLLIGQGLNSITADNWSISANLTLRSGKGTTAVLSGLKTKKLICAPLSGSIEAKADEVYLWGSDCSFTGESGLLVQVDGSYSVTGSFGSTVLRKGTLHMDGSTDAAALKEGTPLILAEKLM